MQIASAQLQFEKEASRAGLRVTKTRQSIFSVLFKAERPLQIAEIVKKIPDAHFVSVYRSVDALYGAGLLKQVPYGFKARFELSDKLMPHHHHATCEICGAVSEINDKKIEKIAKELGEDVGFTSTSHHFEVYGVCRGCRTVPGAVKVTTPSQTH